MQELARISLATLPASLEQSFPEPLLGLHVLCSTLAYRQQPNKAAPLVADDKKEQNRTHVAQEEARGKAAREMQAKLQVKCEPALAPNVKEMQQNAISPRHPGCRLANQTSKGLGAMLRAVQEAELSPK